MFFSLQLFALLQCNGKFLNQTFSTYFHIKSPKRIIINSHLYNTKLPIECQVFFSLYHIILQEFHSPYIPTCAILHIYISLLPSSQNTLRYLFGSKILFSLQYVLHLVEVWVCFNIFLLKTFRRQKNCFVDLIFIILSTPF